MSYPPAKRQRSNTSRESANGTPQTVPPSLRHSHISQGLSLYPSPGYENGGYSLQPTARQTVNYNPYSPGAVTTPTGGYGGPYHTSAAGYGTGPYSPQQQANSFATQYAAQSPSNGHMAYHNTNFHQQPRPNPATSTIQHQHQHALAEYAESYNPQPTAHAAPYHANTNSYPDASVLNSHFSPAPLSSPAPIPSPVHLPTPAPQNGNRHTPEDELREDDEEEDAQGETADESTEVYINPEPPRTSAPTSMPTPSVESSCKGGQENNRCSCKTGRGNKKPCKSCVCSKYGLGCTASCSCGDACGNVFADLTQFFGPKSTFPKPCGANACFATWLCNQPSIEELEMDLMIDIMLYDDKSWATIREYTEPFKKWEDSWKKARVGKRKKAKEERERLEFELLRGGLGNCNQNDFYGYWYSFCRGGWVPADSWYHCQECRVCKPSSEWHCDKHNRCTQERVCPDCASAPYADMMQSYPDPGS
ncbi:hypothetical protein F4820DRAFT_23920 [Hypoxylon rubiginosum]|uniref:Uncharacterized protein n=1 Tax=Hypoxylon rubiginosum TaxID=110542 RepID=A0ACB9YUN2_9PEZI|nr:hypothetical protein F4820DRAFT_23920 [Hypoxylon rubiginosum]